MTRQRRRAPRAAIPLRVHYRTTAGPQEADLRDLSARGFFVQTPDPLPIGSRTWFSLPVPNLPAPLTLQAVVRRVTLGAGPAAGMGVELEFDDLAEQRAFEKVVEALMFEAIGGALFDRLVKH